MDPNEELLKDQPSAFEFESNSDEIKPEEADQISGGGAGYSPYGDFSGV
jgi:hypothetical protein